MSVGVSVVWVWTKCEGDVCKNECGYECGVGIMLLKLRGLCVSVSVVRV